MAERHRRDSYQKTWHRRDLKESRAVKSGVDSWYYAADDCGYRRSVCLDLAIIPVQTIRSILQRRYVVHALAFGTSLRVIYSLEKNVETEATELAPLVRRFDSLRQLHLLTLYIFGFCMAMQIPEIFFSASDAYDLHGVRGLIFVFRCNAIVFFVFVLLHLIQWAVSAKLLANRKH